MEVAGRRGPMYVMGDWNAKNDERMEGEEEIIGNRVLGKEGMNRSVEAEDNRTRLIELAMTTGTVIADTWFDKLEAKKCTYREKKECEVGEVVEVNKEHYEQIDMTLVKTRWRNSILDIEAKHDSGINSDRVPVVLVARIRLSAKKNNRTSKAIYEYKKEKKEEFNANLEAQWGATEDWSTAKGKLEEAIKATFEEKRQGKRRTT